MIIRLIISDSGEFLFILILLIVVMLVLIMFSSMIRV